MAVYLVISKFISFRSSIFDYIFNSFPLVSAPVLTPLKNSFQLTDQQHQETPRL